MKKPDDQPRGGLGLLANGSSGRWDVAVDESLDEGEWSLELDGPHTYLAFQLRDLQVVQRALRFLQSAPSNAPGHEHPLPIGRFGTASVSLVWDNECSRRCFILIGPRARSTLRITLEPEDVRMLVDALQQVVEDLPQKAGA